MGRRRYPLLEHPGYVRFWTADAVSMAGSAFTALAVPIIAKLTLQVSTTELGILRAAAWLPYPLIGLLVGVYVDRHRRRPLLIGSDFARALVLGVLPLAAALDALTYPLLVCVTLVFGSLSIVYDAAHQSFPPVLVPKPLLTAAYARLEQSAAVAQSAGTPLAGVVIGIIGAPLAILLDAISYLVSAILLSTVRTLEPEVALGKDQPRHLRREIREGLNWVYRNPAFGPVTLTSHLWFIGQGMLTTVYLAYVLGFDHGAVVLGITLGCTGIGSVLGAGASSWYGRRFGVGPGIIVCRWLSPVAYLTVPLAGDSLGGIALLCAGQLLFGISLGLDGPIEMAYRQSITPSGLLGRMNATTRSLNRAMIVIGAPLGGILADHYGIHLALWVGVTIMVAQALWLNLSRFRHARLPD
ncbi:MFS transporter [Kribbella sp. NPDC051620]|uniref:MFS transporter n=1 Tax=Kribbella sp. NPDC051620 TaxID=3364120 RepID=UPI0037A74308